MNEIAPSVGACVVCCQPTAAWSVSCFSWTSFVVGRDVLRAGVGEQGPRPPPGRPVASATHLSAAALVAGAVSCSRPTHAARVVQLCGLLGVGGLRLVRGGRDAHDVVDEVLDALRLERALPGRDPPGRHRCPGSAVGDDLCQSGRVSNAAARTEGSAPPTTPATAGNRPASVGVDGCVRVAAGIVALHHEGRDAATAVDPVTVRAQQRLGAVVRPSTARWRTASRRARPIVRGTRRPPPSPGTAPR